MSATGGTSEAVAPNQDLTGVLSGVTDRGAKEHRDAPHLGAPHRADHQSFRTFPSRRGEASSCAVLNTAADPFANPDNPKAEPSSMAILTVSDRIPSNQARDPGCRLATRLLRNAVLFLSLFMLEVGSAVATQPERFAGEARIGSQPSFPLHLELRRSAGAVTGVVSIPGTRFNFDGRGHDTITGTFRGDGGTGPLTLRLDGEVLEGSFDLGGQPGVITARRTSATAETMFKPPEQRLDLTTAESLEDFDRLVEILTREHAAPFHKTTRAAFGSEAAKLRAALPGLAGVQVALALRRLGASIGDGHTGVELPQNRPQLPVKFFWFEDGLRVVSIAAVHRDLLGARLLEVDGLAIGELSERLRAYVPQGETEWFHRAEVAELLSSPDLLNAAKRGASTSFNFTLKGRDGTERRVELTPEHKTGELAVLGGGPPTWQRDREDGFRHERLRDGSVYVNWRSYENLGAHVGALLDDLDAEHPRRLIVDLRDNDGGDYTLGRLLIEEIASRPWLNRRGNLYVLIGRKTFSAAMTNAADFRLSTQAVLVGEPTGAAPNNWQEVRRFHLPNSGLRVGVSTRHYEFVPGEATLRPDWIVPPEPGDWGAPTDAALRSILRVP